MKSFGNIPVIYSILIAFIFCGGCEKREWNNPFDPECPKEIFTPVNFSGVQLQESVALNWGQTINNIGGFRLYRNTDGANWTALATLDKNETKYSDSTFMGDKTLGYKLIAYAGNNFSNEKIIYISTVSGLNVSTDQVTIVTSTAAIMGGTVKTFGGLSIIEKGICYSTTQNPTTSNDRLVIQTSSQYFGTTALNLTANRQYYVRAYVITNKGTSYGNQVSFITDDRLTDIEGNIYKTVIIGDQVWMAENLKTTKYSNGTAIPLIADGNIWKGLSSGAYCYFFDDPNNGVVYGALYNFFAVIDNKKLCPTGWHVPSKPEWSTLINYLGGESVAGNKLKETGTAHWNPNEGATNSSGFTALPGGWAAGDGQDYYNTGVMAWWWTSSLFDSNLPWVMVLNGNQPVWRNDIPPGIATVIVDGYYQDKKSGNSVRCIKD